MRRGARLRPPDAREVLRNRRRCGSLGAERDDVARILGRSRRRHHHREIFDAEKRARRRVCQSPPGRAVDFRSLPFHTPSFPRGGHLGGFLSRGDASPRPRREPRDDDAPIPRVEIGGASVNRRDDQRRHAELRRLLLLRRDGTNTTTTTTTTTRVFEARGGRLRRRLRRLSFCQFPKRLEQSGRLARRRLARGGFRGVRVRARVRIVRRRARLRRETRGVQEQRRAGDGSVAFRDGVPRAFRARAHERRRRRRVGGKGQRRESRESTRGFRVEVRIRRERFNRRAKERRLGRAAAPIGATTTKTTKKARERDAVLVGVGVGGFATERGRRERRRRR